MKIAFVVQRYGPEINGGAELHCRYVAERLARHAEVEVITTCARDYITWENHYPEGTEKVNGIRVRRFKVQKERNPDRFGRLQEEILQFPHTEEDEIRWMEEEGPFVPEMIRFIKRTRQEYDFHIFFSYRYYHSFHGVRAVPERSILVPTAEHDPIINFGIFRNFFNLPRGIVYNSIEERRLINQISANHRVAGDVVGIGSDIPDSADGEQFRAKFGIRDPFLLYVGRIDANKGCVQLFDFFRRFRYETGSNLKLVLIGSAILPVPEDPAIRLLGFLGDADKFDALAAAEMLVMPSFYESLSMVLLEAWGMGKATVANGNCRVLMGQSIRSNAGLFYTDYEEFRGAVSYLQKNPDVREALGRNGKQFYHENYRWEIIEQKYLRLMKRIAGN
jgi:glycosyltransferase involved in cell wall biosynthesis